MFIRGLGGDIVFQERGGPIYLPPTPIHSIDKLLFIFSSQLVVVSPSDS